MAHALAVARYLLLLSQRGEEPLPLTHLHLQKLLYYCQGWSLARCGRPLFSEEIQAWTYGPVVPRVFPVFADHGNQPIDPRSAAGTTTLTREEQSLVQWVWERYQGYSAIGLSEMTHRERPWLEARQGTPHDAASSAPISVPVMREFFESQQDLAIREAGFDPERVRQAHLQVQRGELIGWGAFAFGLRRTA